MNWKVWFLGTYRLKTEERWTTNEERRRAAENLRKIPTKTSRKRYESASTWIFFTETIFLTNFKWISDTRRVEHFCSSLLPLFIGKRRRSLPPSSPKRAQLLLGWAVNFLSPVMKEGRVLLVRLVEWGSTLFIEKCQNKGKGKAKVGR